MNKSSKFLSYYFYDGGFWLRIMGHGISVNNKRKFPPLFSERNGYRKVFYIGKWGIEFLSRKKVYV